MICFTLRFVYGHSKARAEWELKALELEREVCRDHWYPRDEDILALRLAIEYGCFNHMRHQILHHQFCAVAKLWRVQVPEQHYWSTNLES